MITLRQRQLRNQGIGASEIASVLNLDPWRSAYDLWLMKTERHETSDAGAEETGAQTIGNLIEPTTRQLAERRLGKRIVKPTSTYKADNGIMFANLDGQVEKSIRGADAVELKSTGLTDGWGEEGTDEVPDRVMLQVHGQMICSGAQLAYVARLLGRYGFSFSLYEVPINRDLAAAIEERVCNWWRNHVEKDTPPADSVPSLGAISHVKRIDGKVVDVDPSVVAAFAAARDARKRAEEAEEDAKARLLAALGDAEGGSGLGWSVSFKTIKTKRLDTDSLRSAHPEIHDAFYKASSYRRIDVRSRTK